MSRAAGALAGAACVASVLFSGCGEQSISAASPFYALVDSGGTLAVDVLDQSDYHLIGSIAIATVGDAAPDGALAALPGGRVLVTYTGSISGQRVALTPGTQVCSLDTSQCATVWPGWGSATAAKLDDSSVAVPAWDFANFTSGKLAFFGGSNLGLRRQLSLAPSMPGPAAVSRDGRHMYWLTYPTPGIESSVELRLVRVDAVTGRVDATHGFGKQLPFGLAIDPSGRVLVSILYDRAPIPPTSAGSRPTAGVLGSSVVAFAPDLSQQAAIRVQSGPSRIAVAGTYLLAASQSSRGDVVALYDLNAGAWQATFEMPAGWTVSGLQSVRLASGAEVGIVVLNQNGGSRFRLGVVDLEHDSISWHELDGHALGSVAA